MENYKIGDKIQCVLSMTYSSPSGRKDLHTRTGVVTRVTQTQVTIDFNNHGAFRFNIRTGKRVGHASSVVPYIL